ncbi:hypothetical protein OC835_007064 [Tilletia horrida]|nr:hypothetical protein OC835_007064 [Tilletia horrida]
MASVSVSVSDSSTFASLAPTMTSWSLSPTGTSTPTATAAPTDDPYYLLYMGIQATIPFALRNMAVQVALSSVVFTLYGILLFITRTRHRQTWTFALASVVFALFFASAFTNSLQLAHALQYPGKKVGMGIAFGDVILTLCLPWIGDWLIWLRMLSLWPADSRWHSPYVFMFGAPVVVKLFRFAVLCALLKKLWYEMATSINAADLGSKVWPLGWLTWAEYGSMLMDVSICSAICIIRLTLLMNPSHSDRRSTALQSRLRLLLGNTVSSFVLPVVASVVMIILGAVGTFDAYATMTKINAGVTAINVLIAIIIPILQHNSVEERNFGSDPSNQPNSFIRNKMRSRSQGGTHKSHARMPTLCSRTRALASCGGADGAAAAAAAAAASVHGIVQTTHEEAFVDHLDYGVQPYSPGVSLGEKKDSLGLGGRHDDEEADDEDDHVDVELGRHDEAHELKAPQLQMSAHPSPHRQTAWGNQSGAPSPSSSGFERASLGAGGSPGTAASYQAGRGYMLGATSTDVERGAGGQAHESSLTVVDPHHHGSMMHHGGGAGLGVGIAVTTPALLDDEHGTLDDVLRTMPRMSRFGQ